MEPELENRIDALEEKVDQILLALQSLMDKMNLQTKPPSTQAQRDRPS